MRTFIYNRVKGLSGIPTKFGDPPRVISSGSNLANPQKPFLLISFDIEQVPLGTTQEMRASRSPFTVWVHDEPGSMLTIDDAAFALKNGMPTQDGAKVGGMSYFTIEWEEIGQDTFDDHFNTNTRPVRFVMWTHRDG